MNEPKKEYDPRMHSAEHILNQTMVRIFNCGRSFNAHIEKKKSKCDYKINRNLTEEEIAIIEKKVNEVIKQNLNIKEEFVTIDRAKQIVNLDKLPDDAGEKIRIIRIGNYDTCACIGPHVKNTSEIGEFKIISTNYQGEFLRIRFKLINF